MMPVQETAEMSNIKVIAGNRQIKALNVRLAMNKIDYYVPLDLEEFKGQNGLALDVHVNGTYRPPASTCATLSAPTASRPRRTGTLRSRPSRRERSKVVGEG